MSVMVDLCCDNKDCDYIELDVMVDTSVDDYGICALCGNGKIVRQVSFNSFELKYNNKTDMTDWDGNTSQYWKDFKEKGGNPVGHKGDKWY